MQEHSSPPTVHVAEVPRVLGQTCLWAVRAWTAYKPASVLSCPVHLERQLAGPGQEGHHQSYWSTKIFKVLCVCWHEEGGEVLPGIAIKRMHTPLHRHYCTVLGRTFLNHCSLLRRQDFQCRYEESIWYPMVPNPWFMLGGSKVTYINRKLRDWDGVQTLKARYRSEMVVAPFSIQKIIYKMGK